jgi:hypothetical protein
MLRGNPGYRRKQGERGVAGIKMPCGNNAKNVSIAGTGAARERTLVTSRSTVIPACRGPFWRCRGAVAGLHGREHWPRKPPKST